MASIKTTLDVDGKKVEVSNLQKVMYPETGFTKGDVIDYYIKISEHLLPHLKNRPITLKRYPDGVDGFFFYEKQCPPHRPKWVKTTDVPKSDGTDIHYCVMNDLPALVWAANLADLELHTFLHKAPAIGRPNALAFDLDPGLPADILTCAKVGLKLKALFDALGLESFPKTSGSKGLRGSDILGVPDDAGTARRNVDRSVLSLDLLRGRQIQIQLGGVIGAHFGLPRVKVSDRGHAQLRGRGVGIPAESGDKMSLCLGELHGERQNYRPDHVKPTAREPLAGLSSRFPVGTVLRGEVGPAAGVRACG